MAAMLARLAGKQQQLLLQYALRRSPAPPGRRLPGVVPALPLLWSAPFLGGSRRLKSYNAAAGVAVGGDKAAADHHHRHAVGADLDVGELASEEHYSAAGTSSSSSREYHSVAQTVAAADGDFDGGEKMATRPAARGGGAKASVLLGWGEPEPGGGPHYN
ncbi:hypothetical protein OsI_27994 [Oryza sativa Indica Group]|uniref:Uncharacterized protein n=3 Tax=Oryza TaxID=4527 RepID=A0A0E0QEX9_ORYRU|nr:hypothetical protein OsI_27994 [Oryza sativa Indica Group]